VEKSKLSHNAPAFLKTPPKCTVCYYVNGSPLYLSTVLF